MIKVAITDDHPMVLSGLRQMLESAEDMSLCGIYHNAAELLQGLQQELPDILLLDIQLPDIQGDELLVVIGKNYPSIRVLIFTSIDASFKVKQLMNAGAAGYSLKNVDHHTLLNAIHEVYNGQNYMDPNLKEMLFQEALQGKKSPPSHSIMPMITPREREILSYLAKGQTSQQIAEQLFLSIRTVENHRKNLLHKFKMKNTLSMVKLATEMNLIP